MCQWEESVQTSVLSKSPVAVTVGRLSVAMLIELAIGCSQTRGYFWSIQYWRIEAGSLCSLKASLCFLFVELGCSVKGKLEIFQTPHICV